MHAKGCQKRGSVPALRQRFRRVSLQLGGVWIWGNAASRDVQEIANCCERHERDVSPFAVFAPFSRFVFQNPPGAKSRPPISR